MKSLARSAVLFLLSVSVTCLLTGADWARFRGPNGTGISDEADAPPVQWSPTENLKWKTPLPGPGVSSPIVVGDRVFVTCYSGYGLDGRDPGNIDDLKRHLVCIDRGSGKIIWEKAVEAVQPEDPYQGPGVPTHGYASHTPVSDGKHVYVFFGKSGALAFDMDGNQLWQTGLGTESDRSRWGSSASPILYKNMLIVTASAESEAIVALDVQSGKEVWRQEAAGLSNTWSTPILVEVSDERTDLVLSVPNEIWSFNPDNGKLRWYCESAESDQANPSVIEHDGIVYAIGGRYGGSVAARVDGSGDVTKSHVVWTGRDSNRFGTAVIHEDRIYYFTNGIANCLDAKTGKSLYQTRLGGGDNVAQNRGDRGGREARGGGQARGGRSRGRGGSGGRGRGGDYASGVLADGKLYYLRGTGETYVVKAGDEFEQLAVNRLTEDQETFMATPAISNGQLLIRSDKHLYCVGK